MMNKKVLLIGGGGTIGTYVAKELLEKGCSVDIICMEEYHSENERLRYFQDTVTYEYLEAFLADRYYDGILNLLHHNEPEEYIKFHEVIAEKTEQEIFVSSIRAVSDMQHPITEETPLMIDIVNDEKFNDREFVEKDRYALSKGRCERYLRDESVYKNWTIVRPMISSSDRRLDIVIDTFQEVVKYAKEGKTMYEPLMCKDLVAGVEWAGNTGKMLANLFFKKECLGKVYVLSTGHRMTWNDVTNIYTELLGIKFEWVSLEEYLEKTGRNYKYAYSLKYDRGYNRDVDNSRILAATGLKKEDFVPFKEGIGLELKKLKAI